jgi:DNA polymerase elongation subunit (family B)
MEVTGKEMDSTNQTLRCIVLDLQVRQKNGNTIVEIIGKKDDGRRVILYDTRFRDSFSIIYDTEADVTSLIEKLKRVNFTDAQGTEQSIVSVSKRSQKYMGKPVEVLYAEVSGATEEITKHLLEWSEIMHILENDISLETKYLLYHKLQCPSILECECVYDSTKNHMEYYRLQKINSVATSSSQILPQLRVSGFDIETYHPPNSAVDPENNPILTISHTIRYSDSDDSKTNHKKVFVWHPSKETEESQHEFGDAIKQKLSDANHYGGDIPEVIVCSDERDLIQTFASDVVSSQPDIIVGYSSDNFDMRYLIRRAKILGIPFKIGLNGSEPISTSSANGAVSIYGIVHIDLYKFIRRFVSGRLKTKQYSLDAVAGELLGAGKAPIVMEEMYAHWDAVNLDRITELIYYNHIDTKITLDLYFMVQPNMMEFMTLIGNTLFSLTRMSYSKLVEYYLMQQAVDSDELIPELPEFQAIKTRRESSFQGAFVYQPTPNLYHNIAVFDFRSLYPSIIISHNISPETLNADCPENEKDLITLENKHYWFCKNMDGFIPRQLNSIITRRGEIKKQMADEKDSFALQLLDAQQYSLKILLNSFYGYLGFFGARWYSMGCVESVTYLGRQYIMKVIDDVKALGLDVIYSDTDSIFVLTKEKTLDEVKSIVHGINEKLPGIMELSFESFCSAGIFVSTKEDTGGAKKKYALLKDDGDMIIKGFETIRRNWCPLVKEVQSSILKTVLSTGDFQKALDTVSQTIKQLKEKRVPVDKLILSTALTKNPEDYNVVTPAVAAAKKLQEKNIRVKAGSSIRYVVADIKNASAIRDKVMLPEDIDPDRYDANYYIENQILPAVRKILEVGGITENEIDQRGQDQQSLSQWA